MALLPFSHSDLDEYAPSLKATLEDIQKRILSEKIINR